MVSRVKLFLLALFFLFHTTTFAYFPICCGCFLAFLVVAYPAISFFAFFGVHFRLPHTLCFIFSLLFGGRVPRYFILCFFLGYISVLLIHYVSYFPCFLVALYPAISFFAFFGVHFRLSHTLCFIFSLLFSGYVPRHFIFYISLGTHLLVHHLLWLQHTPIHRKRTPTFYFLHFSGYATQLLNLFSSPTMHKRIPCGTSLHTVSFN